MSEVLFVSLNLSSIKIQCLRCAKILWPVHIWRRKKHLKYKKRFMLSRNSVIAGKNIMRVVPAV